MRVFGEEFIPAVDALRQPARLSQVLSLSVLTWVLTGCMYPLLALGFGRDGALGYGEGIAILAFTMMGMALPSFFGFAGTYEAAVVLALSLFGISGSAIVGDASLDDLAAAYALTMHWWVYIVQAASAVAFAKQYFGDPIECIFVSIINKGEKMAGVVLKQVCITHAQWGKLTIFGS